MFNFSTSADETLANNCALSTLIAEFTVDIRRQYRNLRDGLIQEPRALPKAEAAMRALGIEPKLGIIRGGTDGSRLTERGLSTPNLFSGEHNAHGPLEWVAVQDMEKAVAACVELLQLWARPGRKH